MLNREGSRAFLLSRATKRIAPQVQLAKCSETIASVFQRARLHSELAENPGIIHVSLALKSLNGRSEGVLEAHREPQRMRSRSFSLGCAQSCEDDS